MEKVKGLVRANVSWGVMTEVCMHVCLLRLGSFTEGRALFLGSYFIERTSCLLVQSTPWADVTEAEAGLEIVFCPSL